MFVSELIVGNGTLAVSLDLQADIPLSLNYAISDIREPEKRNGSYSKTIKLKGTKTNNKFFEHTYHVNIASNAWNPNIKTACYVLQAGAVVFEGYLRLLQINVTLVNSENDIEYEVSLFGDNNTLFAAIGDAKLESLNLSAYNHIYNRVNQHASWSAAIGSGYVYPLIDYGYNSFLTNSFLVENFRPAIYTKAYVDEIFIAAGKTYSSTFLTSNYFKRLIVPHNGDKFTMSAANLATYEFYAGNSGIITSNTKALAVKGTGEWCSGTTSSDYYTSTSASYVMNYNDDTTNPFTDSGNRYDTATGIFTIGQSGVYNISYKYDFEIKLATVPAGTVTITQGTQGWTYRIAMFISTDGGLTYTFIDQGSPNAQSVSLSTSYQTKTGVWNYPATNFNVGTKIKFAIHPLYSQANQWEVVFKDGLGASIVVGTASMEWRYKNTATVKATLSTSSFVSGQILTINDAIPKDIKQRDFLTSIFKLHNLYIDIDPDNPNNYLIETRDDFYAAGTVVDWSNKLAWDKQITIKPMAELDWKTLIYKYKEDKDYYNKQYFDAYNEPYGSFKKTIVNDFTNKESKNEVIFSPTPIVDNPNNTMIIPKIFDYDGTVVKVAKHNIRILYYSGVQTITTGTWNYIAPGSDALGVASLPMATYPRAGMVDDPLSPTVSIEFGVPNEVYYSLGTYYTTNNLFNRYFSKQVAEITDRDAKIVTCYVKLDPSDISQFDFRDKIFLKDAYYYVNKIMDYNFLEEVLTKVELIKIKNASVYIPTQVLIGAINTNVGNIGMTARVFGSGPEVTNTGNANNVLIGSNNSSRSAGSFVSGQRNSIGEYCEGITMVSTNFSNVSDSCSGISLMNCSGIYIGASCHDITLTNCFGLTFEEKTFGIIGINLSDSAYTIADNRKVFINRVTSATVTTSTMTSSFNVDPSISLYYIDCTAGNIIATFDKSTFGTRQITFTRVDATGNTFSVTELLGPGTTTFNGNVIPYNTAIAQYASKTVTYNSNVFYII